MPPSHPVSARDLTLCNSSIVLWNWLKRPKILHLSLMFQSVRFEKFQYFRLKVQVSFQLFTPVMSSPGLFGFQMSCMNIKAVGSSRFCGMMLPGNGVRTYWLVVGSSRVVQGS